jgi:hypothetical protein
MVLSVLLISTAALPSLGAAEGSIDPLGSINEGELGRSIWENGTALEGIGLDYPAYRCAGSEGANASAQWIVESFQAIGLEAWTEEYQFYGWDLLQPPELNVSHLNATGPQQISFGSFQAEHYSYPTGHEGVTGGLALLPIPKAYSYSAFAQMSFPSGYWDGANLTGKVVLVGREVRWNQDWERELIEKLEEGPAALIYYYSQDWSSSLEVMFQASAGGRPVSQRGSYLFSNEIPVGCVDAQDAAALVGLVGQNATARITIDAAWGIWEQSNVVARLAGEGEADDTVMLTAHYDSVTVPGFCDNALSVASVIGLAGALQDLRHGGYRPERDVLFVAFSGEEMGLVGSSYYYSRHAEEMDGVRALINLDCLGAGTLTRTSAPPLGEVDLGQLMQEAAAALGISLALEEGGSDHQSFQAPATVAANIQAGWGRSPVIPMSAHPVLSAISVLSSPLSPLDGIGTGHGGWIHTARDSSGYALESGWVTEGNLDVQSRAVLSVLFEVVGEVEPQPSQSLLTIVLLAVAMVGGVAVIYLVLLRRKGEG